MVCVVSQTGVHCEAGEGVFGGEGLVGEGCGGGRSIDCGIIAVISLFGLFRKWETVFDRRLFGLLVYIFLGENYSCKSGLSCTLIASVGQDELYF